MKNILYILILSINVFNAQNNEKIVVGYLDEFGNYTDKEHAVYFESTSRFNKNLHKYQKYVLEDSITAQIVENYYYDDNNKKQGKYISYAKNGLPNSSGYFKDGFKIGIWKYYYNSIDGVSQVREQVTYRSNLKTGKFKLFHKSGELLGEGENLNDQLFGVCKWYFENGQISSMEVYNNKGKLTEIKQWDEQGVERKKDFRVKFEDKQMKNISEILGTRVENVLSNQNISLNLNENEKYKLFAKFQVDKEGRIKNVNVRGPSSKLEDLVKRTIQN